MDELKACPFCGGRNVKLFYDERQNYHVECYKCNKTVSFHIVEQSSQEKAIEIYNRRAEPENNPLTLEQLRQMDGEPVWIKDLVTGELECLQFDKIEPAHIHAGDDVRFKQFGTENGIIRWCCKCGENWLAYARKPEREEK